ncbi:MAG TPA: cytochrome c-type biogenesis protein [Steroidobacteraceae bacterium]|nr:cytochrome c-type biogenesis protein [Steroidobacteraceae bacterium]
MSWRIRTAALAVLGSVLLGISLSSAAFDIESMPNPEMQKRYDALVHELRCMQCQNQSIADSPVGLAEDLRRDVREQIIAGKTDAEIRESMVARYGNVILFRPPFKPSTAWVWIAPFLLLLVGVLVAVRIVRQRASMVAGDESVVETDEPAR